ncbi:uncharacterized protein LOC115593642 isoform X2 [Sparus aurata]|uniref:uncharacterized protein LOC115593642 isoform X2 n=1 Tax=Sparus aurata TaxID=8175 RepID=UPI0011C0E275|nr:uncharacterized protein LOC115593642 isoform X2 [Sparus aurata]
MLLFTHCYIFVLALVLLSLALLFSLCLNVIFCIGRRAIWCRDTDECRDPHVYDGESLSQDIGHYIHNLNHHEQQENPHNHHEQLENPIYGNISTDRRGSVEVCYEMMTMQHARDRMKPLEADLNYASLDLKLAKNKQRKKKHYQQQGHAQRRGKLQNQLSLHLEAPANAFSEVEVDMDAQLPPRDTSIMVSHSSIYLNSQQIAQETEDMERERGIDMEGWEAGSGEWKAEQESEERKDYSSNGSVCTQLSELEGIQSVQGD